MSGDDVAAVLEPAAGALRIRPGHCGGELFDPAQPLLVRQTAGLTLAVVSIAWLRDQAETTLDGLRAVHLAPEEAAFAAALPVARRRWEWLAGRLAVKHGVRAYQLRHGGPVDDPAGIRVVATEGGPCAGRPAVTSGTGPVPEISLAHSGGFAIAACGVRRLGIDLERSRQLSPLITALLAADEEEVEPAAGLVGMPLPLRWACREAVLKYFGFGLRVDVREVCLLGWESDGSFSWRPGPELMALGVDPGASSGWAKEIAGYSLAVVQQGTGVA